VDVRAHLSLALAAQEGAGNGWPTRVFRPPEKLSELP